jgi:restriction system protein
MSAFFGEPANLTPQQFEAEVESFLRRSGVSLSDFRVQRLKKISAADGVYEIDVTARFEALGADFLVLVECKHHRSPIKREVVQVLRDRVSAVGGQKGMIFSTAPFQSGAMRYARAHGIALVLVANGSVGYMSRTFGGEDSPPPFDVPDYSQWIIITNDEGQISFRRFSGGDPKIFDELFREVPELTGDTDD